MGFTGFGLLPLYVAYLNGKGPGDVCSEIVHGGHSCLQAWKPWPWARAGTALVIAWPGQTPWVAAKALLPDSGRSLDR
jgi:hypothetical protein